MAQIIDEAVEQERRELEELIRTPGWRRFLEQCAKQYSADSQLTRLDKMLNNEQRTEPDDQLRCVREVRAAANAVFAAVRWPQEQAKKLERQLAEPEPPLVPRRA